MEFKPPPLPQKLLSQQKLDQLRTRVEKVTDGLGEPIDSGIKETVVMFNAFGLRTTQSCEGHIDLRSEEYSPHMAPWVEIYPEEPEQEKWFDDDKLRKKVIEEREVYLTKILNLLNEFYINQEVPDDVKLIIEPIAYGFRVQSSGLKNLENPSDKDQQERAMRYKKEMERFTLFLRDKFLRTN